MVKKFVAELIGTAVLVFLGCGTAMLVGCESTGGHLMTALAFGFAVVAMAFAIGPVSGCHINPAVSLAAFITGSIRASEMALYMLGQVVGAFIGSFLLKIIFNLGSVKDMTGAFGANSLAGVNGNAYAGIVVEVLLTFVFVLVVLCACAKEYGGIVIGLSLVLVHILGIGLTGTSVNPARSLGPVFVNLMSGNQALLPSVWVFIVGPLVGACLAAFVYIGLIKRSTDFA